MATVVVKGLRELRAHSMIEMSFIVTSEEVIVQTVQLVVMMCV